MRNLAGPSFGCVHIFFSRSGIMRRATCIVFVRGSVASAAPWSSDVLPYLGPEIIAVLQAAWSFASNDSQTGPSLTLRKSDDRIISSMVLSSTLRYFDSRTGGLLNVRSMDVPDAFAP
jgi:hypothetical protein